VVEKQEFDQDIEVEKAICDELQGVTKHLVELETGA